MDNEAKSRKVYGKSAGVVTSEEVSASAIHTPKWSSKSLALFSIFVAIFLAIAIPGILYLLPFRLGINFAILIGFLLIVGGIFWWQRYHVLMLIRKLESKFGGEKTV